MRLLILNFIRLRWLELVGLFVISAGFFAVGWPMVIGGYGIALLMFDARRGLLRTVRPLPVSRRGQDCAWWFVAVLLLPLVTLFAHALGAAIHQATYRPLMIPTATPDGIVPMAWPDPMRLAPWFAAVVTTWLGFGHSALSFLLSAALPTRVAGNRLEAVWQACIGAAWGLNLSAPMAFMFILPRTPAALVWWHWAIFAVVPVLVIGSFLAASEVTRRRASCLAENAPAPAPSANEPTAGGLTGICFFLATYLGRSMLFLSVIPLLLVPFAIFTRMPLQSSGIESQILVMGVFFTAFAGEFVDLRSLRVMPISTLALVGLLLILPLLNALVTTIIFSLADHSRSVEHFAPLTFLTRFLAVAGCSALALAASFSIASGVRYLLVVLIGLIPSIAFRGPPQCAPWFLVAGAGVLVVGMFLFHRGVRNSPSFYRPRTFFGMNIGGAVAR